MASVDLRQSTIFSRLRGLLEVTRLVRGGEELPGLLHAIARTVSDSLGFRTVVINLHRREWNDLIVSTVYGSDEARDALLGQVREIADWEPLLDERFLYRGAYLIRAGDFDWSQYNGSVFTPDLAISDDPNAWHPDDALFAPLRATDGSLLGILSVDEPLSGRRPSGDEIDVLVAVSEHAALAVQSAQEHARAKANRDALDRLLQVSTRLNESFDAPSLLDQVCTAISEALGFEKVAVQLLGEDGRHHTAAVAGLRGRREHRRCDDRRPARPDPPARVRRRGVLPARARAGANARPEPRARATARSTTAAARTRGRTTGSSCRSTTGAAAASATSGSTTRSTACGRRRSGCRSCARLRTRRRPHSSRRRSSRRSRRRRSTTAR